MKQKKKSKTPKNPTTIEGELYAVHWRLIRPNALPLLIGNSGITRLCAIDKVAAEKQFMHTYDNILGRRFEITKTAAC